MRFQNFTNKAQKVIEQAVQLASSYQNQSIEAGHLLKAIQEVDPSIVKYIFQKNQASRIDDTLAAIIQSYAKVSGAEPYLSSGATKALQDAEAEAKQQGDTFVAVEFVLLGILTCFR